MAAITEKEAKRVKMAYSFLHVMPKLLPRLFHPIIFGL